MIVNKSDRAFEVLVHAAYPDQTPARLVQQSSAIGNYLDAFDRPGSSFLWIGRDHHLSREDVAQLIKHLQSWLDTGSFQIKE